MKQFNFQRDREGIQLREFYQFVTQTMERNATAEYKKSKIDYERVEISIS